MGMELQQHKITLRRNKKNIIKGINNLEKWKIDLKKEMQQQKKNWKKKFTPT
jgi:hypothetical protein